jgi:hypothetical protein
LAAPRKRKRQRIEVHPTIGSNCVATVTSLVRPDLSDRCERLLDRSLCLSDRDIPGSRSMLLSFPTSAHLWIWWGGRPRPLPAPWPARRRQAHDSSRKERVRPTACAEPSFGKTKWRWASACNAPSSPVTSRPIRHWPHD